MSIQILMPALSPTMTEGTLARWLKAEGDTIKAGDVIAEIETDKATMEVEAVDEGTLGRILVGEGSQGVKVNQPIALILEEGEKAGDLGKPSAPNGSAANGSGTQSEANVSPSGAAALESAADAGDDSSAPRAEPAASNAPTHPPSSPAGSNSRVVASPLARRIASQSGLDLSTISGSGPNGRIVKADVEKAVAAPKPPAAAKAEPSPAAQAKSEQAKSAQARTPAPSQRPAPASAPASSAGLSRDQVVALAGNMPFREVPHTPMRRVIARRLTESKQTVPHFYLTVDCTIDALLKVRAELNSKAGDHFKLSVNDFVIRASALALAKVPAANASWSEDGILEWQQVDVAVAVAIENGLITPIIKQADRKGLQTISNEMRELGQRAKAGKLKLEEFQGGTFSISNLGMYGVREFAAVINPPHGCILAVGAGEQRPVVKDGALGIATVMSCTLSVDHRVVDGAVGAQFMAAFKKLVEDPLTMLL